MNRLFDLSSFIQDHLALQKPRFIALYDRREVLVSNSHSFESSLASLSSLNTLNLVDHIILYNISIRKFSILPLPEHNDLDRSTFKSVPDYPEDDSTSNLFTGFWIDFRTKEFKIIMLKMDAILFTSTERRWKLISPAHTGKYETIENPVVIIRGMAYWRSFEFVQTIDGDEDYYYSTEVIILSFDFEDEVFCTIEAPLVGFVLKYLPVLYRMQDSISLMYVDNNFAEIYTRGEDSWICIFTFDVAATVMDMLSVVTEVEER
ncbi:hypothetical protein V2J09_000413 [Rumex salicifolius]